MKTCPVCLSNMDNDSEICDKCGFKLVGATESFASVFDDSSLEDSLPKISYGFPTLVITKGPMKNEVFHLSKMPISIGRDPACDLFLNNMTVSRDHALIYEEKGRIYLKDTNSMNGTWVNGRVADSVELNEGDTIQIGTFTMCIHMNDGK